MKLAIFLNQDAMAGGGYYESLNRISDITGEDNQVTLFTSNPGVFKLLSKEEKNVHFIKLTILTRFSLFLRKIILDLSARIVPGNITPTILIKRLLAKFNSFERSFKEHDIDLVYFTSPEPCSLYLENTNYIFAVWDLAHFELPFFPEIRQNHVFETREILYRTSLPRAYAITVGHAFAKKTLIEKYNQNAEKIFILPFRPSKMVIENEDTRDCAYGRHLPGNLPNSFVYYPAQYAAHKNHVMVIDLIYHANIKAEGSIGAVFTGADRGNKEFLMDYTKSLDLESEIIFLDFQPDASVFALLKSAVAVVAPTYIGPGTLPTMEAMYVGTPVFVLDNWQNREFYGDAAFYLDPDGIDESILALNQLGIEDKRREVAEKMKVRYKQIIEADETELLKRYISEFNAVVHTTNRSR